MSETTHSRIESQLTDPSYGGPYLSRIERILKDMLEQQGKIGFRGPYESVEALPDPGVEGYIYLVETEDEEDYYDEYYWNDETESYQPMGSTKMPELLWFGTGAEWSALTNDQKRKYVNGLVIIYDDVANSRTIVDVVENGNMNAVTSNAVYDEVQEVLTQIPSLNYTLLHTYHFDDPASYNDAYDISGYNGSLIFMIGTFESGSDLDHEGMTNQQVFPMSYVKANTSSTLLTSLLPIRPDGEGSVTFGAWKCSEDGNTLYVTRQTSGVKLYIYVN